MRRICMFKIVMYRLLQESKRMSEYIVLILSFIFKEEKSIICQICKNFQNIGK